MIYLDLFKVLAEKEVRYALVGGVAMNLYGVPRMTMDVDIVVDLSKENLRRLIEAAEFMGLRPRVPVPIEDLADAEKRTSWVEEKNMIAFSLCPASPEGIPLDLIISTPVDPLQIISRASTRMVGDVPVKLASAEDIISLKRVSNRAQDISDIEHLRKATGG